MKRLILSSFLMIATVLMAQSLVTPNPPIGQQFYYTNNSFSISCRSNDGIAWSVANYMKSGALKVNVTAQGGGQSKSENLIINSYSPIRNNSLGRNSLGGGSYEEYTVSGSATCDYIPSDHVGSIGSISVSYYGVEL